MQITNATLKLLMSKCEFCDNLVIESVCSLYQSLNVLIATSSESKVEQAEHTEKVIKGNKNNIH